MPSTVLLLKIGLAAFIAGALDSVVGFAGALLLLPALALILGSSTEAVLLSAVISLGWNGTRLIALWKKVDWSASMYLTIGIVPGVLVGALIFAEIDPSIVRTALAVVLILSGAYFVARLYSDKLEPKGTPRIWVMPVLGFLSGGISAVLGAGNGPMHAVALRTGVRRMPLVIAATTGLLGFVTAALRVGGYNLTGSYPSDLWIPALVGLCFAVGGSLLGVQLSKKAHDSTLELIVGVTILLAGIRLLF